MENPGPVYAQLMDLMCRIVRLGLIHCVYNEFNILISPECKLTIIDFPQMVSIAHANARELFERDVQCVMRFFRKKLNFWMDDSNRPTWEEVIAEADLGDILDRALAASGFRNEDEAALNSAIHARGVEAASEGDSDAESDVSDVDETLPERVCAASSEEAEARPALKGEAGPSKAEAVRVEELLEGQSAAMEDGSDDGTDANGDEVRSVGGSALMVGFVPSLIPLPSPSGARKSTGDPGSDTGAAQGGRRTSSGPQALAQRAQGQGQEPQAEQLVLGLTNRVIQSSATVSLAHGLVTLPGDAAAAIFAVHRHAARRARQHAMRAPDHAPVAQRQLCCRLTNSSLGGLPHPAPCRPSRRDGLLNLRVELLSNSQ